jgi:serine protease Do
MGRIALVLTTSLLSIASLLAQDQAPEKGRKQLPRVSLGIAVEELPNDAPHGGVVIREVTRDGPAARAGLKTGDVVVRVSDLRVDDLDELLAAIAGHKPGDQLTFTVLRSDAATQVKVTLGESAKDDTGLPKKDGPRRCTFLGVLTVPPAALSDDLADRFGLADENGIVVMDVVPGSPAADAGLRHGDVIRAINGKEVRDPDTLRTHVQQAGPETEIALQVRRGDRTREVKATLADGPCDVRVVTPRPAPGAGSTRQIELLRQRIEQLERRIKELEARPKREPME